MGKSGERLRAEKARSASYVFTAEQLREHDRQVLLHEEERLKKRLEEELAKRQTAISQQIQDEWDAREKIFKGGDFADHFFLVLSMLLAVSSRVLIERFGWKPIPKDEYYDRRNRTARFADYLIEEVNGITGNEEADIRNYCDEVYNLYGVRFLMEDDAAADAEKEE